MFISCVPVMCTKNNSVITVKKHWCLKLLAKIFACKFKHMRRFFLLTIICVIPFLEV